MTGYQSKRAAAQDKLAQPEQEALKLALEALKEIARHATTPWEDEWCGELANETLKAINALAQPAQAEQCNYPDCKCPTENPCLKGLAQPAQEPIKPVAWLEPEWGEKICPEVGYEATMTDDHPRDLGWIPLVAQRTWVGLTEENMPDGENPMFDHEYFIAGMVFAAKILEEKNT